MKKVLASLSQTGRLIPILMMVQCMPSEKESDTKVNMTPIEERMLSNSESEFYRLPLERLKKRDTNLPIGVFDSGTGGLTVLEEILKADQFTNGTNETVPDEVWDFDQEQFVYLADQANMPYGHYSSVNKTSLLQEHILKDLQFLLSDRYYQFSNDSDYKSDKQPVKAVVIACNTATAYGMEAIRSFMKISGLDIPVIGVIDAGANAALEVFEKGDSGSIAVFATVGTVASNGYQKRIQELIQEKDLGDNINIYDQAGHGLAESLDGEKDFISGTLNHPRKDYRGPSLVSKEFPIDTSLLDIYNFDFTDNKVLCEGPDCEAMQLNDIDNYVRYHIVSMMEKISQDPNAKPLKAIVLGCTHYPYVTEQISATLNELRSKGYQKFIADSVYLIDPAVNTAKELYARLYDQQNFNSTETEKTNEFFISVPNVLNGEVKLDQEGAFTYEYKYGRSTGVVQEYVKVVPFSTGNIPEGTLSRLKQTVPGSFQEIAKFTQLSSKTQYYSPDLVIIN